MDILKINDVLEVKKGTWMVNPNARKNKPFDLLVFCPNCMVANHSYSPIVSEEGVIPYFKCHNTIRGDCSFSESLNLIGWEDIPN